MDNKEDFDVIINSQIDDTQVVTIASEADLTEWENNQLYSAIQNLDNKNIFYSVYAKDDSSQTDLTIDRISELATDINNNLPNLLTVNAIIRERVLTDELVGRTYDAVYSNVNTEYMLSYPNPEGRNKQKTIERVKQIVEDFNDQVDIGNIIRDCVSTVFLEGNGVYTLKSDGTTHVIDRIPLGIAYVSDYLSNGLPIVCIDTKALGNRLKKTYSKNKKRKAVFFEDIKADIKANYPEQVYEDYINGESISRLDTDYTKVIRINNLGRKYGVSPIFRALKPLVVLDNLSNTDIAISKSKQRKILLQILRKEVITDFKKKGFAEAAHAHAQLMSALSTTSCAYTAAPFVESVSYVAPPKDDTNIDKRTQYQRGVLNALGIEFIDTQSGTVSVANISLEQLLRLINAITEQIERMFHQYYKTVLRLNNIDPAYAPKIRIIDCEQLDAGLRKDLASFIYTTLGASLDTTYKLLGFNIEDERIKREKENEDKIDEIFYPRVTSYTVTNNTDTENKGGRPANEGGDTDVEKQTRDKVVRDSQ